MKYKISKIIPVECNNCGTESTIDLFKPEKRCSHCGDSFDFYNAYKLLNKEGKAKTQIIEENTERYIVNSFGFDIIIETSLH